MRMDSVPPLVVAPEAPAGELNMANTCIGVRAHILQGPFNSYHRNNFCLHLSYSGKDVRMYGVCDTKYLHCLRLYS